MPVKIGENQLDEHARAQELARPSDGARDGGQDGGNGRSPTADSGWRIVVATAEVWVLALLKACGRGLRALSRLALAAGRRTGRLTRRHWPQVWTEVRATPGELAAIAAGAAIEAASDLAALARTLGDGAAWTAWAVLWAARGTAAFMRRHWPGFRRMVAAAAGSALALMLAAGRLVARAGWVGLAAVTRGAGRSAVWVGPRVLSAMAAVPSGVRTLRGWRKARAERPWPVEQVRPSAAIEPLVTIGPQRLVVRLMAIAAATALTTLVLVLGAGVATRAAVAAAAGSAHMRKGHVVLPPLAERSIVYAADGSVLAVLHVDDNRQPVTLSQMAPVLVDAVVDTEDAHFWKHGGVDPPAMIRALAKDVAAGRARQGGSTIAQQLVKNTLLSPKRNVGRKIKEIVLADRVEHELGKRAVLERYLNTVYFGEGAYGVEAAAETYFAVPASRLDPGQAALLAGLIQDPDGYNPMRVPAAARQRRQTVLGLLVSHHHLAPEVGHTSADQPLPVSVHRLPEGRDYFTDAVRQELLADRRLGATQRDRYFAVFAGGLRIRTTLDPGLQRKAEAAIAGGLPQTDRHLTAALVAEDPGTGAVRALVGGPDFGQSQFDAALAGAGRQPGSSFKAFTLAAALEAGYSPADVLDGSTPCSIANPGGTPDPWVPGNFEGEAFGPITLTDATAHSVNCAYARLAPTVGLRRIADLAHSMGITSHLSLVPSMTLGTNVVTPLQMASAYATLAAEGMARPAHLVEEVDGPDGKPLVRAEGAGHRALSAQTAREETQVLQQVVLSGTGQAAAVAGHPVAGKTGTAENYQDAWFVGYTPDLATAVWMGDPDGEVPMRGVQGINVVGGTFPARMWSAFMTQALADRPVLGFAPPDPALVPAPTVLVTGQARPQTGPGAPAGGTYTTTWCMSSCGRLTPGPGAPPPGPPPGAPPPGAPAPGQQPGPPGHQRH